MFRLLSFRIATSCSIVSVSRCAVVAVALFATAYFAAPRQASAIFEYDAYEASYNSLNYSWYAWQTDGNAVVGSYQYWATIYSYYGYAYALYGHQYDLDSMFDTARDYHLVARGMWQDLIDWNAAGDATYVARDKAQSAADWCWWAWAL